MSARLRRQQPWAMQALALFDHDPEEPDELPLVAGQHIRVLQVQDDGWWLGYAADAPERVGLFPSNYVRQVVVESAQQQQQQQTHAAQHKAHGDDSGDDDGDESNSVESTQPYANTRMQASKLNDDGDSDDEERWQVEQTKQHHVVQASNADNADDTDDEQEAPAASVPQQQRMISVLQLKRSLADAERASDAARSARMQAERERAARQQRRAPVKRVDRDRDADNVDESDNAYQQRLRRPLQRTTSDENDGDGNNADETFQFSSRTDRDPDRDSDNEHEAEDEEVMNNDEDETVDGTARNDIGALDRDEMDEDVEEPERQRIDTYEHHASRVIAHSLQRNVRSKQQQRQRQKRSFAERQHAAALAIQRWMLRTSSQQRQRRDRATQRHDDEQDERPDNEDDGEDHATQSYAAATRIQTWIRQLLAFFRWQALVERERVAALKKRRLEALQRESEQRRRQTEAQAEADAEAEAAEREQQQHQHQQQLQQIQAETSSSQLHASKPHRKVMKKEAVELVRSLVKQQLDEKLCEHDAKIDDLQRLVTTLQDVIRKQSAMLLESTAGARSSKDHNGDCRVGDTLVTTTHTTTTTTSTAASKLPTIHKATPALTEAAAPTRARAANATQRFDASGNAATATMIPTLPSRTSQLPYLPGASASTNGSSVAPMTSVKPTGIRPPRANDIPSRFPVLTSSRASASSSNKR